MRIKKIIFTMILSVFFISCAGIYTTIEYRIKNVEKNHEFGIGGLVLKELIESNYKKTVSLYMRITDFPYNGYHNLEIHSSSAKLIFNKEKNIYEEGKYKKNKIKIIEDIIITKKSGEKIIINKENMKYIYVKDSKVYPYKKDTDSDSNEAKVNLKEFLEEPVTLEIGKIKINNEIYKVPKIYLNRYKISESNSLLRGLMEDAGPVKPLYHKEGWIEE